MSPDEQTASLRAEVARLRKDLDELKSFVSARFGNATVLPAPVVIVDREGRRMIALGADDHGATLKMRRSDDTTLLSVSAEEDANLLILHGEGLSTVMLAVTPLGGTVQLTDTSGAVTRYSVGDGEADMNRACPDCRTDLVPIKLLASPLAATHMLLHYTPIQEGRAFWTGRYSHTGAVSAWKCPECGLIRLYGDSAHDTLPLPASGEPSAACLPLPSEAEGE
jgi:hypothetical protein